MENTHTSVRYTDPTVVETNPPREAAPEALV